MRDAAGYATSLAAALTDPSSPLPGFRGPEASTTELRVEHGRALLAELHIQGWNRYGWPVEAGGLGGGARHRAAFYDELSRAGIPAPEQNVILETIGPPILRFGPDLAARFLPACLRGEESWAQGFSEPEAGSDLAALRCRASREGPDGDFVVNGQKTWTTLGHLATRIALLCRTGSTESRHRGLSMLLVDLDSPGVTVRPIRMSTGTNETAEVFFTDVRVRADRVIGEVGQGWAIAMYLLQYERGMYAWMRQAVLFGLLGQLAEQVPAGARENGATRRALGEARLATAALRARSGVTVRRLADGETVGPDASADKLLLSRAEQTVLDVARRVLGPMFVLDPGAEAERWRSTWFYTRAASIYGGSAEIQRGILADRVLMLPGENDR
ncbi:acyl-CoA dehydrogenase family protein [Pseudonocardia sp. KRD-291]|nr:acyl-CoA dehydrogenase family protein [Pseudonocardia sp. KRD291]